MSQKLGNTSIKSVQNITSDGTVKRVILDTGADLNVHREVFERNVSGTVFSFQRLGFETEADKKRRERHESGLNVK